MRTLRVPDAPKAARPLFRTAGSAAFVTPLPKALQGELNHKPSGPKTIELLGLVRLIEVDMKKLHALICLTAAFAVQAGAQDEEPDISSELIETWSCYDTLDYSKSSALVVLSRHKFTNKDTDESVELGEVEVAAISYGSLFSVTGFDRRWDFGPEDQPTSFAFIIKPNGDGLYYDFTNSDEGVKPSQFFKCEAE